MGKKKTQGKTHATHSFEQLVAKANRDALKPYIHELFMDLGNDLSQRVFRQLANIQTRIMAIEELLIEKGGISESDIQLKVANIEDEATGYKLADRPAQAGDLVRVTIETKAKGQEVYSSPVKRQITKLLNKPYSLTETIENALVGTVGGDVKDVTLEGDFQVRVTVDRVSMRLPTPEAALPSKEVAPAKEDSNETEQVNESQNA